MTSLLTLAGLYAPMVTKIVDAIRNVTDKGGKAPKFVWNLVAFAVGVVVAFSQHLSIPALGHASVGITTAVAGIAIGAAAGGWHEAFDAISGLAKTLHANANAKSSSSTP